ncbi:MAG TPA: glycoside hydrolase family 15 protein [Solirubrobacterales bacterium]|nr:glycoside hydrolase family 15 protein [Solirubrobacterales bacterium]
MASGRDAGYMPLREYAAIGDGRTSAFVAGDGSLEWLCLPDLDSPSIFAAVLDAETGGSFSFAPEQPFATERRYLPDTNVLETTFETATGSVRVTDAMLLPDGGLVPTRELARRVEGLSGEVPMRWRVEPRFHYGKRTPRIGRREGTPVATAGGDALAVSSWAAGAPVLGDGSIGGSFVSTAGSAALVVLSSAHREPLVLPSRADAESRLSSTISFWRQWSADRTYRGPWRDAVIRSALVLKLLIHSPSGAIAAAGTASLPEQIGGERNWDYRFCWVRDSAFTLHALMQLGCPHEGESYFWWLLHASQLTHPRLRVLYRLNGSERTPESTLPLSGYRGSEPVRIGNGAGGQEQLDVYGDLMQTAWLYATAADGLDADTARRLAEIADLVCEIWRLPDSGIWEVRSEPLHFTHSKIMCWVALDRAVRLAERGLIPRAQMSRWRAEAEEVRGFIEELCWSEEARSYTRAAGSRELDASLLLGALMDYPSERDPGLSTTISALRRELGSGPLLDRYSGEDGVEGKEGAFLCCSFWLADALARAGRVDEAAELTEQLIGLANDVGLYAEEIDQGSGAFLGNLPQGLVHLALINAAVSIGEAQR